VIGHGDTKATDCPGRNVHIADVRKLANQQLASGDAPADGLAQTAAASELLVTLPHK
jgi:hypothetical protein